MAKVVCRLALRHWRCGMELRMEKQKQKQLKQLKQLKPMPSRMRRHHQDEMFQQGRKMLLLLLHLCVPQSEAAREGPLSSLGQRHQQGKIQWKMLRCEVGEDGGEEEERPQSHHQHW